MWFARNQIPDDVGAYDLFVHGVGHDVFGVEGHTRLGAFNRRSASTSRREPGDDVISVDAKWPIAAPRSSRCSPNIDIKLIEANASAGTSSR